MSESADNVITERGIITKVSQDHIQVLCRSKLDCKRCDEGKGCGGGILARWLGDRQHQIQVPYSRENYQPQVDQVAEFSLPASLIVKMAAITYGLPLLFLAVVFFFISSVSISELTSILIGTSALILGFLVARKLVMSLVTRGHLEPELLSLHSSFTEVSCSIENITIRKDPKKYAE